MTKQRMIETLLEREEELYKKYEETEEIFGRNAEITKRIAARWGEVRSLCRSFGLVNE